MTRLIPTLLLLFLGFASLPAGAQQLASQYTVHGTNPDGSHYQGTVELFFSPRLGAYAVTWYIGRDVWEGSGVYAEHEGAFEVTYDGGVAYYSVQPNGILDGMWGSDLRSMDGREIWYPR